jgi:hypothetical protein
VSMAMNLAAASVASATEPLFNPTTGTLTVLTGTATLANAGTTVTCSKSNSPGTITKRDLIVIVLHFLECQGAETGRAECPVHSEGAPAENLILTKTLHGILGLVLPHVPAILLLPTGSKELVTLEGGTLEATAVTGNVTGELSPIGKLQLTAKLVLGKEVGTHFISSLGGLTLAKLTVGSLAGTATFSAAIDYGQLTEVT